MLVRDSFFRTNRIIYNVKRRRKIIYISVSLWKKLNLANEVLSENLYSAVQRSRALAWAWSRYRVEHRALNYYIAISSSPALD